MTDLCKFFLIDIFIVASTNQKDLFCLIAIIINDASISMF